MKKNVLITMSISLPLLLLFIIRARANPKREIKEKKAPRPMEFLKKRGIVKKKIKSLLWEIEVITGGPNLVGQTIVARPIMGNLKEGLEVVVEAHNRTYFLVSQVQ